MTDQEIELRQRMGEIEEEIKNSGSDNRGIKILINEYRKIVDFLGDVEGKSINNIKDIEEHNSKTLAPKASKIIL